MMSFPLMNWRNRRWERKQGRRPARTSVRCSSRAIYPCLSEIPVIAGNGVAVSTKGKVFRKRRLIRKDRGRWKRPESVRSTRQGDPAIDDRWGKSGRGPRSI